MSVNLADNRARHLSCKHLKVGASLLALATVNALHPAIARAEAPFGSMVGMQAGQTIDASGNVSVWQGANAPIITTEGDRDLMIIEQTEEKAVLDWEDFRLQTQEILEFQQQSSDWFVINRVHGDYAAEVNGEIRAIGSVYIFNDNGVLIGDDAVIDTRQLVVGSGMSDVNVDGNVTTFTQSSEKAVLDWQKFVVDTDEVLRFEQQDSDWLVINRDLTEPTYVTQQTSLDEAASVINGTIEADGIVVIEDTTSFLIGEEAEINASRYFLTQNIADVSVTDTGFEFVQGDEYAIVNWSDMNLAEGETMNFVQDGEDWMLLNRSIGSGVVSLDGTITADEGIVLVARDGLSINGTVEAGQVVASALDIRDSAFLGYFSSGGGLFSFSANSSNDNLRVDPTFSNSWFYPELGQNRPGQTTEDRTNRYLNLLKDEPSVVDPNDPLKYAVTVGSSGAISTADKGKIMLFGPNVHNYGTLNVQDEGEVVMAAGDNIFLGSLDDENLSVFTSVYNPLDLSDWQVSNNLYTPAFMTVSYNSSTRLYYASDSVIPAEWVELINLLTGGNYQAGDILPGSVGDQLVGLNGSGVNLVVEYAQAMRQARFDEVGFSVINEGVINGTGGSDVTLRGSNIEQNGAITLTSTASFRADIDIAAVMQDAALFSGGTLDTNISGNGTVTFGKGSLTQITPDLEDTDDVLALTEGNQSVGSLFVAGETIHMLEDSLIYMPSGTVEIYADSGAAVLDPLGASGNTDEEDGSRFQMEAGATIDLAGWDVVRDMGYNQVTGTVYVAQLSDSPVQADGPLYLEEISVDRRYGTNVVDWESFDNLSEVPLDQLITAGGTITVASGDDFIMKDGSVIDVSGGSITYEEGYVYTTLIRQLDGTVIDIREANPDTVYMGLASQWTDYDTKWGKSTSYYIPLISSARGQYEESYVEGANAGSVNIWAADGVYQGAFLGDVVVGKYQGSNIPDAGSLTVNAYGEYDEEYLSTRILIAQTMARLGADFGVNDSLTSVYGDLFGEEENGEAGSDQGGGLTLLTEEFFENSTMGSYDFTQYYLGEGRSFDGLGEGDLGQYYTVVEDGVNLDFANGADLTLLGTSAMYFGGSVTSNGGDVVLRGQGIEFAADSFVDTSAKWHSDYELMDVVERATMPIIDGGDITILAFHEDQIVNEADAEYAFVIPETVTFTANGGGYLNRDGVLNPGTGGDIDIRNYMQLGDRVDLSGAFNVQSYGLGGNSNFIFETSGEIHIGEALADDEDYSAFTVLLTPDFFENMAFGGVYLSAPTITIADGTELNVSQATMELDTASLVNGVPSAWLAQSGTDIMDVTTTGYVQPGYRADALQDGATLSLSNSFYSDEYSQITLIHLGSEADEAALEDTYLSEDSSITVNPGGTILFDGTVAGTISAPAGTIGLSGALESTARILAQGAVRFTGRTVDAMGNEILSGEVLDGGTVTTSYSLANGNTRIGSLTAEDGALIDVSGISAELSVVVNDDGSKVNKLATIASDGGLVQFTGANFDVNNITFKAEAGGDGARGGQFALQWRASDYDAFKVPNIRGLQPRLTSGYWRLKNGGYTNSSTGLQGVDLSTVDFSDTDYGLGVELTFAEGTYLPDDAELTAYAELLQSYYDALAANPAPVFYIGSGELPAVPDVSSLGTYDDTTYVALFEAMGYGLPEVSVSQTSMALSPERLASAGFSSIDIGSTGAMVFAGQSTLGGYADDGSFLVDSIRLSSSMGFYGDAEADFTAIANEVRLQDLGSLDSSNIYSALIDEDRYAAALDALGVTSLNEGTSFTVEAGKLLDITGAAFSGFADISLATEGDLRFSPTNTYRVTGTPEGSLTTQGNLTLKADQVYTASGRKFTVEAGDTLTILGPDEGSDVNETPLDGAASLTLRAPRLVQGGIVRSPLGSITLESYDDGSEGADTITLLAGSITSVSADGNIIPYGTLVDGDTWVDPFTGLELTYLPDREVNLLGDAIDFQDGATVDISAGGDLVATEWVSGTGGTHDWLTGYFNADYNWVEDDSEIFAIIPGYDADVTPLGMGSGYDGKDLGKIYLSGNNAYGLPEGEYALLPAEYATLDGAYRVSVNHQYGDYTNVTLGTTAPKADGSVVQAGYRFVSGPDGSVQYADQYTDGYLVMSYDVLSKRSEYNITSATEYFSAESYLAAAERTNLDVTALPRTPNDGGGLSFIAGSSLTLDGDITAKTVEGGKGGYVDVASDQIVIASDATDLANYDDYLVLDVDKLVGFNVESLLIGGSRETIDTGTAIGVGASEVVIDTAGASLSGAEMIFAANETVSVKSGSVIEATGTLSSPTEAYTMSSVAGYTTNSGVVHGDLNKGALLAVSAGERAEFLRDSEAVEAMAALLADPAALATINATRTAAGLDAIGSGAVTLALEDGVSISGNAAVLDATGNTTLAAGVSLDVQQVSAAGSSVSIGDVPGETSGLIFAGDTAALLSSAQDVALKSYTSIDIYGEAEVEASGDLTLDAREIRLLDNDGTAAISADTLTLANSSGGEATATGGNATLVLSANTIELTGGSKALSGADDVTLAASGSIVGSGNGGLSVPANLTLEAAELTVASGSSVAIDAGGALVLNPVANDDLDASTSYGATLAMTAASITNAMAITLNGGTIDMTARTGDITLADGSMLSAAGTSYDLFDYTIGVDAGTVSLTADQGDVVLAEGGVIDVSGGDAGDAGLIAISAANGDVVFDGTLKGEAGEGYSSGDFDLRIGQLADFAGLNAALTAGSLNGTRSFEILTGDVTLDGSMVVEGLKLIVDDGALAVTGAVTTTGDNGGTIALAASDGVALESTASLVAAATSDRGKGGTVRVETSGANGTAIEMASGALIDVSGGAEGAGGMVHFRAPQIGGDDVAIGTLAGTITGADRAIAEAYAVYDDVETIDADVIDTVEADASAFMDAASLVGVEDRLGGLTLVPGIDIRNDGDIELVDEWDLSSLRFGPDQVAGVLSLRATGDLLINANLIDENSTSDYNWALNLVAGANLESPSVYATLAETLLAQGKGSVIIGGEADLLNKVMLNPDDYDLTQIVGSVGVFDYAAAFTSYYDLWAASFNAGEVSTDDYQVFLDDYYDPYLTYGTMTAEEAYLGVVAWTIVNFPAVTAGGSDYGDAYTDLDGTIYRYYADDFTDSQNERYNAIYDERDSGAITGKEAYSRLVSFLYEEVPDVYNAEITGVTEQSIAAAPYYLRVNGRESVLYNVNADGTLGAELERDFDTGYYIDPVTGGLITYEDGARDYTDTDYYARSVLPLLVNSSYRAGDNYDGIAYYESRGQTYNPVGYQVSTNNAAINVAAARDLVLEQRPSSMQTTGSASSINIDVAGDLVAHDEVAKTVVTDIITDGSASINVGGLVDNLSVAAGDLVLDAGGDILGGIFDVTGTGVITSGGSILSGSSVQYWDNSSLYGDDVFPGASLSGCTANRLTSCDYSAFPVENIRAYDLYTIFRANDAGSLSVKAAGDVHIETATGGAEASVSFYSAGGDITVWNNDFNLASARLHNELGAPYYLVQSRSINSIEVDRGQEWAGTVGLVAAGGDVLVNGGFAIAPYQYGNLDIMAQGEVQIGSYAREADVTFASNPDKLAWVQRKHENNYRSWLRGIYGMSARTETTNYYYNNYYVATYGSEVSDVPMMLHEGDLTPSRIYTGTGDINLLGGLGSAEQIWIKSGGNLYYPDLTIRHNNLTDVSQVSAAGGIYFGSYTPAPNTNYTGFGSHIAIFGDGNLEIEAGSDLYIPDNEGGIIAEILYTSASTNNYGGKRLVPYSEDGGSADVSISVGYNQQPDYEAFFAAYLDPETAADMADYLKSEVGGEDLSTYLFDTYYARGNGAVNEVITEDMAGGFVNYIRTLQGLDALTDEAEQQAYLDTAWDYWVSLPSTQETPYDELVPRYGSAAEAAADNARGEFFLPEYRQGLVNYVRALQGLEALASAEDQLAYLDEALSYWADTNEVYKLPFYRDVLFLETRTSSREANDADSDRAGSVQRGYDAIATLYPGAQKAADEALADGESRWAGNFDVFASPIQSNGGGDIDIVAPGGFIRVASAGADAAQTGQPTEDDEQGNALRAGVITQGGGEIDMLSYGDIDVNQARVLTTQGGNVLMWSSYGDIAAGNGAKTSLTAPFFDRSLDDYANLYRSAAGLPTGAGIGTLATTEGVPPADVDLIANYGIVDAGDAGIRVSGNLNVFAIEILGVDNIDVTGRTSGLPEAPAAPPTSLDVGDLGSKSLLGSSLLEDLTETVRSNAVSQAPSIIQVRVTGYGEDPCADAANKTQCEGNGGVSNSSGAPVSQAPSSDTAVAAAAKRRAIWESQPMQFDMPAQELDSAVQEIGRISGFNILYNSGVAPDFRSRPVQGAMPLKDAMARLLGKGLRAILIDDRTIMIEATKYAQN